MYLSFANLENYKKSFILFLFLLCFIIQANAQSIENIDKEISKITIALIGKKIIDGELKEKIDLIKATNNKREVILSEVVDLLQNTQQYRENLYYELNKEYFEGISKDVFSLNLKDAFLLYSIKSQSIYYDYFVTNYHSLLGIYEYLNGRKDATIKDLHRFFTLNMIYDQINMGDHNFVISTFQHFIGRKPTKFELEQSLDMLNSHSAILFNHHGTSRQDYVDILLNSSEYWQGQINYWFKKLLYRLPTQEEILIYLKYMYEDGTPERLIKEILIREL